MLMLVSSAWHPRYLAHALSLCEKLSNSFRLAICICVAAARSVWAPAKQSKASTVTSDLRCPAKPGNRRRFSHGVAYHRYTRLTFPFAFTISWEDWPSMPFSAGGGQTPLPALSWSRSSRKKDMRRSRERIAAVTAGAVISYLKGVDQGRKDSSRVSFRLDAGSSTGLSLYTLRHASRYACSGKRSFKSNVKVSA